MNNRVVIAHFDLLLNYCVILTSWYTSLCQPLPSLFNNLLFRSTFSILLSRALSDCGGSRNCSYLIALSRSFNYILLSLWLSEIM